MCGQRSSPKIVPTEKDLIEANIASFGNDVGTVTNYITSMYEVRSRFEVGSPEYNTLQYRIKCGQQKQQDAIDKAKGIISKPMEKSWYNVHSALDIEDEDKRDLYVRICSNKKPYFMRYIYPKLMKEYNTFVKSTDKKCYREHGVGIDTLMDMRYSELTDSQKDTLTYYSRNMPVGVGDCVMNKICRIFEREFDGFKSECGKTSDFDYSIMYGCCCCTDKQYRDIKKLIKAYNTSVRNYKIYSANEKVEKDVIKDDMRMIDEEFRRSCEEVCPNEDVLCNIVLDICYSSNNTKRFAWRMCGKQIIKNLLHNGSGSLSYPAPCEYGNIEYCGNKYIECVSAMEELNDYFE